jgi:16S rRNA (guanine(966)-N(2))-methyltransferase RsmD
VSIRVIAGVAKGRQLKLVPGDSTRPIMDRVKESLFNIIGRDIFDATFIDLFAGTGSVGIEALSRGAAHCTFIDLERSAVETIRENLLRTKLGDKAVVKRADALALVAKAPPRDFDFIYVAPPQYQQLWLKALQALDRNPAWIPAETNVIAQIDPAEEVETHFAHLEMVDQRRYGNTLLLFYMAREAAPDQHRAAHEREGEQQ